MSGFKDLVVEGAGAEFIMKCDARPLAFDNCEDVTLRGPSIDWERPPFSQGVVISVGEGSRSADIQIDSGYPIDGNAPIPAFATYDRLTGLMTWHAFDIYGQIRSSTLVSSHLVRLQFKIPIGLKLGDTIVLRHEIGWPHAVYFSGCKNIRVEDVAIYAAPGMAIVGERCDGASLHNVQVIPRPLTDRLLSTNTDAVHLASCTGAITVRDLQFRGMGDDGINVHGRYLRLQNKIDSRTATFTQPGRQAFSQSVLPSTGTYFSFASGGSLSPLGEARIAAAEPGDVLTLHFDSDLGGGVEAGDLAIDQSQDPRLTVSHCQFREIGRAAYLLTVTH